MNSYALGAIFAGCLFAYMLWKKDEQLEQVAAERDAANDAIHDLMADNDTLTAKLADYEILTGSWTASVLEGGDQ